MRPMTTPMTTPKSEPMKSQPPFDLEALPPPYAAILRAVAEAPVERPFVVAQLGQSLDGRIALPSGESRWINNAGALDHVHRLRALVDAVVVGVGTALADDPQLNVRRVAGRNPARVLIDRRGRCAHSARLFSDDGAGRALVTSGDVPAPEGVRRIVLGDHGNGFDPRDIVEALYRNGWRRILVEGGAGIVSAFVDAGVVDRLHVLVAPVLLGCGKPGLTLKEPASLAAARRPPTHVHVLDGGDVLFDCDMRSR